MVRVAWELMFCGSLCLLSHTYVPRIQGAYFDYAASALDLQTICFSSVSRFSSLSSICFRLRVCSNHLPHIKCCWKPEIDIRILGNELYLISNCPISIGSTLISNLQRHSPCYVNSKFSATSSFRIIQLHKEVHGNSIQVMSPAPLCRMVHHAIVCSPDRVLIEPLLISNSHESPHECAC